MKNVREGYKMTELGEIPEEWNMKRLCDISEINPKKEITEDDKDVSFIAMEDVSNQGGIIKNNIRKYGDVKKGYTAFKNNDVLLAKITPCFENGKKAIATQLINEVGFGSTEFHVLRAQKNDIIPSYIYYTISTNRFMQKAQSNMTGSAGQKRVPTEFLKEYTVATPPIKEQQKISLFISSVDEKIEITDNLIEKTKELKKGLMQRLLTKGIGHERFKDTEIGRIPEEWEIKSLNEIAYRIGDGLHGTPIYSEYGSYYFINGNNLTNGKILLTNETKKVSESEFSKYKKELTNSTILISLNGTIGNLAYYNFEKVVLGKSAGYITLKEIVNKDYILFALSSNKVQLHFYKELTGTTIKNLSLGTLRNTNIPIPNIGEQKEISLILSSVDEKIEQYETKKQKLQELKKGLMQKLLTGKIRVKV